MLVSIAKMLITGLTDKTSILSEVLNTGQLESSENW